MDHKTQAKTIVEMMKNVAKVKTYGDLGELFGGISSQAISRAISKGKIPENWFRTIESRFGVAKDELYQRVKFAEFEDVKSLGGSIEDMDREKFTQDMNGLFSIIMQWQEEENGADPLTSMQFIQLFHERIPELGEWIKKRKGSATQVSPPENLSVANGEI